ncbi:MAG TPA: glycosyltransferase family 87 protein [Acidimicrobiales bacterium]|nr:glycosyltransferase family 87 protein [Acidimicrobiales bacterium]
MEAAEGGELRDTRLFFGRGSGRAVALELRNGSSWAKGLWFVAVLIGLLDAYRWHGGAGVFAYDAQHVWEAAHAILHGRASWNQFVYPPGCLLFAFPLAALPFKVAKLVVYAVGFLGVAYTFWALTRMIRIPLGSVRIAWSAVLLALSGQLGVAAHFENFTLLLVPLAAAFFLAVDRERPMAAGVILGVSLTVKPLLVPLLLVLLLARRWSATAVAVLIPVVLSALTMVIVVVVNADPSGFLHEVEHTFSANSGRPWNTSLSAMAGYLHAPDALADVVRTLMVGVSLFTCWRIWKRPVGRAGEQAVWLTAPLFSILILCFSFAWGYYALLLLPLGFVSLRQDRTADWIVRVGVFLALAPPLLVYTLPGYPDLYFQDGFSGNGILGLGVLINGATVVGVLVALAATVVHSYQGDRLPSHAASLGRSVLFGRQPA